MSGTDVDVSDGGSETDRIAVEMERDELRDLIAELSVHDIRSGGWFTTLLAHALSTYTEKVDWQYFQSKYAGVPPDAIVAKRIQMAARYAAIEGGLSASAYTGAVAATLGSLGGASAVAVPAAITTMMVDVAYTARLQLRLAYDISVLYGVPLDTSDPDDLWRLIRIAFTIKSGEAVSEGVLKAVPIVVKPLVRKFYSKGVLSAAKGLPVVGKYLLQRNVIKIGIPLVGVPLSVIVNRQTTLIAGRHARLVYRNEARLIEMAEKLTRETRHPALMLWVAWLVVISDDKILDDEVTLFRHLVRLVQEQHGVVDDELARVVTLDPDDVWRRLDAEMGDLSDLVGVAEQVAALHQSSKAKKKAVIAEMRERCL